MSNNKNLRTRDMMKTMTSLDRFPISMEDLVLFSQHVSFRHSVPTRFVKTH